MDERYYRMGEAFSPPNLMGKLTGEYRPPKAGEYYLSGAIPEVWKAGADLRSSYYVAKLVKVRRVTRIEEVKE
jgi:hypothetical protein